MEKRELDIFKVTLVGSTANLLLTAFKFVAGIVGHSAAMTADAIHSLSDLLTDAVVLLFVRISGKPEDRGHDYGHGKYETLATTIIGLALAAVAVGIGYKALAALVFWMKGGTLTVPGMLALWAAVVSVLLKELVYQYTVRRGRKLNSLPSKPTPGIIAAMPSLRSGPSSASAAQSCLATAGLCLTPWLVL